MPLGLDASLAQRGHELLAVLVVPEDILALVPTVHDVIHGPGILNAQLARHAQPLPTRPGSVNSEDFTHRRTRNRRHTATALRQVKAAQRPAGIGTCQGYPRLAKCAQDEYERESILHRPHNLKKANSDQSESHAVPLLVKPGHIYLLRNPAYREHYHKLGKTADTVEKRAKKLSQPTGVPSGFLIVYQHRVADCDKAENMAKERLKNYRVADTEFFDLPQNEAIRIIMEVVNIINTPGNDEEENPYAHFFLETVCELFDSGRIRSLNGEAIKIQLFYLLAWANSRESFTLKEFVDKTGIPEEHVIELLKELGLKTEEQIWSERKQQEEQLGREIEEDIRSGRLKT